MVELPSLEALDRVHVARIWLVIEATNMCFMLTGRPGGCARSLGRIHRTDISLCSALAGATP